MSEPGDQLEISVVDDALVVSGEIDAHSAPQLHDAIAEINTGAEILVDMSGVAFVDSSGLRTLIDAHQAADAEGRRLVIRRPSDTVLRLFEISGVTDYLNVAAE